MPTNSERAEWARLAVDLMARETGVDCETRRIQVHDLLCNLMHLCEEEGLMFKRILRDANQCYMEESIEDEP